MATAHDYIDRMLSPLADAMTPEVAGRLTAIEFDPSLLDRIDELAEKCTEGELSDEERIEYETYVRTSTLIAILQSKARRLLDRGA